jgi:hypothetical protein
MAEMVASIRGSSAGKKPTMAIIRFEASRSGEPKDLGERLGGVVPALVQDRRPDSAVAAR